MPKENSQYTSQCTSIRRWTGILIFSCLCSAFFCFSTFWVNTDVGLLLALMSALLGCIIGVRLYLFDIFMLSNNALSVYGEAEQDLVNNIHKFLSDSPDLFWRIRYAGREVESLNNNYADIHPGSASQNARITTIFPARVARQYLEALIEVQSQDVMKCFEYQLPLKNNKTASFEARIQPFSNEVCIAMIRDITDLKEKEETLFDQQLFVRQVMDSSPFFMFVRDRFGRFLILNQAIQDMLGHETLVQSHLIAPEAPLFFAGEQEVLKEGHSVRLVDHIILKNGEKRWFEVTKAPLNREKETYVLVTAIDITHLKVAETLLKQSEENCMKIFSYLTIPLAMIDRQSLVTLLTNEAMANLLQQEYQTLYASPLPFIDEPLQHVLKTHSSEESVQYTLTLENVEGITAHTFLFQPINFQDRSLFLVLPEALDSQYKIPFIPFESPFSG